MKLNSSDDKIIENFDLKLAQLIDPEKSIYGIKIVKPNSIKYFYFSKSLQEKQLEAKARTILKKLKEAKEIQEIIAKNKKLPKKFRINNELIEIDYSFKTKLEELSEEEAIELLKSSIINGREGFFCLKSNKNLTLEKALEIYREKDSIEKIFNSLKNEIQIKPLRVWSDNSIYGALLLGFIAQLFISLMRYEFEGNQAQIHKIHQKKLEEFDTYNKVREKWSQKLYFC